MTPKEQSEIIRAQPHPGPYFGDNVDLSNVRNTKLNYRDLMKTLLENERVRDARNLTGLV